MMSHLERNVEQIKEIFLYSKEIPSSFFASSAVGYKQMNILVLFMILFFHL